MLARRFALAIAAATLFGGEPPAGQSYRIECACPISVRGGKTVSYKSSGKVRTFTRAAARWIVVDGPAEDLSVTVPPAHSPVLVRSLRGDVDVRGVKARVEAITLSGKVFVDDIDGAVSIEAGGEIRAGRIRGNLRATSAGNGISVGQVDGEVWCETAGGEIIVERAGGVLHAATGGGNIYVAEAASSVDARTDGGLIDIQRAGGFVTAATRGGSIQVGAARGARCESAAGAIRVRNIAGVVRAQTAVGNILAELVSGGSLEESSLATGGGDITVMFPSNLSVSVRAVNESRGRMARIISEFPEIRVTGVQAWPLGTLAAQGALNGGGPVLNINGAGGTVSLRRQK